LDFKKRKREDDIFWKRDIENKLHLERTIILNQQKRHNETTQKLYTLFNELQALMIE
jgi:hypothetical protein